MNIRRGANGYLQIVNDQQEINKARSSVESLNFENEKISSLIKEISKESINLKCYIRTINLPGLGLGQRMGLEHKVLEVYLETTEVEETPQPAGAQPATKQKSIKKLKFLFSVGGKQILDLEYIDNKLAFFTDINDADYYLEFPDQFLQYDLIKKKKEPKDDNLFIDSLEGKKLVDYLSILSKTGKHNYLEDYIGMTIARDLYKVDEGAGKIKKSSLDPKDIKIDKSYLIKLLFVLLVNKNRFDPPEVIGNYDEVESDPKIQETKDALRELEEKGVYCVSAKNPGDYYSEYDNKLFFTNIFTNVEELPRLDSMFNKYYKEIINAVGILFHNYRPNYADICIPVYQLLRSFFKGEQDKIILLENRMIPDFFNDMYDFNGIKKTTGRKLSKLTGNLNKETKKSLNKLKEEAQNEAQRKAQKEKSEQLSDNERKKQAQQKQKEAAIQAKQAKRAEKAAQKEAAKQMKKNKKEESQSESQSESQNKSQNELQVLKNNLGRIKAFPKETSGPMRQYSSVINSNLFEGSTA